MKLQKSKAQIMVLDVLILFSIALLILFIELSALGNYNTNIKSDNENLNYLKESLITEKIITDCNYLGAFDQETHACYQNKIDVSKESTLSNIPFLCNASIENESIYAKYYIKKPSQISCHTRAVISNENFKILEVCFCYD